MRGISSLRWWLAGAVVLAASLAGLTPAIAGARTQAHSHRAAGKVSAMAVSVPQSALVAHAGVAAACVLPDGSGSPIYHCYTPQDIRAAYGVDKLAPNYGQGQTIVLVDSYGMCALALDRRSAAAELELRAGKTVTVVALPDGTK